jgi:hypothetical protein
MPHESTVNPNEANTSEELFKRSSRGSSLLNINSTDTPSQQTNVSDILALTQAASAKLADLASNSNETICRSNAFNDSVIHDDSVNTTMNSSTNEPVPTLPTLTEIESSAMKSKSDSPTLMKANVPDQTACNIDFDDDDEDSEEKNESSHDSPVANEN